MGSVDWQIKKAPLECTKYLLENNVYCDVNFKVGEDPVNIKAHKLILSMRSPVFDRMFNSGFEESEKDPVIPDVTVEAFKTLLRYCYYECLDVEDDVAFSVVYASKKYMLPLLEESARKKLIEILRPSTVWDVFQYAINVEDTGLHDACKAYFEGSISSVREALQTEAFLNIPHQILLDFLHINDDADRTQTLNENPLDSDEAKEHAENKRKNATKNTEISQVDKPRLVHDDDMEDVDYNNNSGISIAEIDLFKGCNVWAEAECVRQEISPTGANKRTVLGEAVLLVRFPTMLQKDLAKVVYPTGILTQAEIVNLCQFKYQDPGCDCPVDFPSTERQFIATTLDPSATAFSTGAVFVESDVKVILSRVWIQYPGSFRVTLQDDKSDSCWSMKYDAKHKCHCTNRIVDCQYALYYIDIQPRLLESGTRYSIKVEQTETADDVDPDLIKKWIVIGDLSPFKEVKITHDSKEKAIYALTLSLA